MLKYFLIDILMVIGLVWKLH